MVVLLFLARNRFQSHNLLVGTLQKNYGQDLVKEARTLDKLNFKYRKALLDFDLLISSRNNIIPKFLHPSISNKELWSSAAYNTCQKHLLNQEILNKQKAGHLKQC